MYLTIVIILDGVVISNIRIDGPNCPIFIRLGNRNRPYFEGQKINNAGVLQNVTISNVIATGANKTGCSITGIPGYRVQNLSLSHINIEFAGGGTMKESEREVPEKERSYPEADMFDILPSFGLFIRHAQNVTLSDIVLSTKGEEHRPAIVFSDVISTDLDKLQVSGPLITQSIISLDNSDRIRIRNSRIQGRSQCLVNPKGDSNTNISLLNNELNQIKSLYPPGIKTKKGFTELGNLP